MLGRLTLMALLTMASGHVVGAQTMESQGSFSGSMLLPQDAQTRQRMPPMATGDLVASTIRIIAEDDGTGLVHLRLEQQNGRESLVKPSSLKIGEGCRNSAAAPQAAGRDVTVAANMGVGGAERCAP